MSKIIIISNPEYHKSVPIGETILNISEFFYDTIQGEGVNMGIPSAFIRFMDCVLGCTWCDSKSVWHYGNAYSITELLKLFPVSLLESLKTFQIHLVLTGGSPLRQQFEIEEFFYTFREHYGFIPYLEIENECSLKPSVFMLNHIKCWNNSPKLNSSGNSKPSRYKPTILKLLSEQSNSWFKFVVTCPEDWDEIDRDFLRPELIRKGQIILMPEGDTQDHLLETREMAIQLAITHNVRYSDRLHIVAWNKRTGV